LARTWEMGDQPISFVPRIGSTRLISLCEGGGVTTPRSILTRTEHHDRDRKGYKQNDATALALHQPAVPQQFEGARGLAARGGHADVQVLG
jgi:hypothetical protein